MVGNKFRSDDMVARCMPMSNLQAVLGGKWKILIVWYIAVYKTQRFGELMRRLEGIARSTLTKQLRELENDGFIHREAYRDGFGRTFYPCFKSNGGMERKTSLFFG